MRTLVHSPFYLFSFGSDVELEENDVAILDQVLLALLLT